MSNTLQLDFNKKLSQEEINELLKLKGKFNYLLNNIMDTNDFDLSLVYKNTDDLEKLYNQLSDLKKCLDSFRPLNKAQLKNLQEAFDTEYTYESNRIEGNTLTLMETELVINKGLTIGGKSIKDHQEAINHKKAIDYIRNIVKNDIEFNNKTLLEIHLIILYGIDKDNAGVYRRDRVRISGSRHICPNPVKVPELMDQYFKFYEENKKNLHPVELASNLHEKLLTIHPFIDGNGRTARLVMNLLLLKSGYPITIITSDKSKRTEYYNSLETAQISDPKDNTVFQRLMAKYVKQWLFKYLNMVSPSINEKEKDKGYYFFKRIEPFLNKKDKK